MLSVAHRSVFNHLGIVMTQPKISVKSRSKTPDPQQFPQHAQTEATAGRDKVREVVPVHAPRQSKRPLERTSKSGKGA